MKKGNKIFFGNVAASLIACLWVVVLIVSCKVAQTPIVTVPIQYKEKIVERLVPVVNPEDSANVMALFECDSANQVILKSLSEEKSRRVESQFTYSQGQLKYGAKTKPEIIYLPAKDSIVSKDVPLYVNVPGPTTNILTWWQKTQIYAGRVLLGFLLAFGVYKALKFKSII